MKKTTSAIWHFIQTSIFIAMLAFSGPAAAGILGLTGPTTSSTGSYTLSWDGLNTGNCGSDYYVLTEYSNVIFQGCDFSFDVVNKPQGSYFYELSICVYMEGINEYICIEDGGHTVEVMAAPQITLFKLSATTIYENESVSSTWNSINTTYCTIEGDPTQYLPSFTFFIPGGILQPGDYAGSIYCTGPGGDTPTIHYTLTVLANSSPPVLSSFSVNPAAVTDAQNVVINWGVSSNADTCSLSPLGTSYSAASGSATITAGTFISGAVSLNLTCYNSNGPSATLEQTLLVSESSLALTGFDYSYNIFGAAGRDDILVVRDGSDGNVAGVNAFILEPDAVPESGDFYQIRTNPTQADFDALNVHISQVPYEIADINGDGVFDMVIKGLEGTSIIPGRLDTIIYAVDIPASDPLEIKEIDQEFKEFYSQLNSYLNDPKYFDNNAPLVGTGREINVDILYAGFAAYTDYAWLSFLSGYCLATRDVWFVFDGVSSDVVNPVYDASGYIMFSDAPGVATGLHVFCADREEEQVPDYSVFSQDAMDVSGYLGNYLTKGEYSTIPADIWQIIEEFFGVSAGVIDEPGIINKIRVLWQIQTGAGADQDSLLPPVGFHRLELVYTDIGLAGVPPLARHAYVVITSSSGDRYVTRGGPELFPTYGVFGELEAQFFVNPGSAQEFADFGKSILFRQEVGLIPGPAIIYQGLFATFAIDTNVANIDYELLTQNSNSYAFQVVEKITGTRPRAIPYAPGWKKVLEAP